MHKGFLKTGAALGFLSVALGAFAAHRLKEAISDYAVSIFETGVRYQFYHVFALLATGMLYQHFSKKFLKWAGACFIIGTILFSVSLYILALVTGAVSPGYRWIGAITPFGGLFLLAGWILLFFGLCKPKQAGR